MSQAVGPDGWEAGIARTQSGSFPFCQAMLVPALTGGTQRARRKKNGNRSKEDIAREQRELTQRTAAAITAIAAHYHDLLPRAAAASIGALYARYSTRFQDSIEDQVRSLFEHAYQERIFIPVENVFYDLAAKGYKQRRPGLNALEQAASGKQFRVLLVFATNRLFRKQYMALKFVEEQVDSGIRCIFTNSKIDTSRGDDWRMLLQFLTFMDERGGSMYADHVRAGHVGLFLRRMVHGSLSLGYYGVDVPGELTKRKKPRQLISVDPTTSPYVTLIFEWFAVQRLSFTEIARRLNEDPDAPPPEKSLTGLWSAEIVREHLLNERYRGDWEYGRFASKWSSKKDYPLKTRRPEPLQKVHFEELRLISDEQWYRTQQLLAETKNGGGRPSKDGNRKARPKMLRHLFYCPRHSRRLTVGGAYGKTSFCKPCTLESAENRCLFSQLNRKLAVDLTCNTLARFLIADENLIALVIETCQSEAQRLQAQDPSVLRKLKTEIRTLTSHIDFSRRNPGETEEDQEEAKRLLRELSHKRTRLQQEALTLERQRDRAVRIPSPDEVRQLMDSFAEILRGAANSTDDAEIAEAREIINGLTGERIELHQMGERRKKGGWLQGRFHLRLLSFAVSRLADAPVEDVGTEVRIDYRPQTEDVERMEKALSLYKLDKPIGEIAEALGCGKGKVRSLLKAAAKAHGEELENAKERSKRMLSRTDKPALYRQLADAVHTDWEAGLSWREMGRRHNCTDTSVKKAIAHWHTSRGLPLPSEASRQDSMDERAWHRVSVDKVPLWELAEEQGVSSRSLTLRLKKYCARHGIAWIDGRTFAGKRRTKRGDGPQEESPS